MSGPPAAAGADRPGGPVAQPARGPDRPRDRWHTGYVVLGDPPLGHRPNPDDPAAFMCQLPQAADTQILPTRPAGTSECGRCALAISRARKRLRRALGLPARRQHADPLRDLPRPADPEQADRHERTQQRGTSVRTVAGGLPTLGKRY